MKSAGFKEKQNLSKKSRYPVWFGLALIIAALANAVLRAAAADGLVEKAVPGTYAASGDLSSTFAGQEAQSEIIYIRIDDDGNKIFGAKGATFSQLPSGQSTTNGPQAGSKLAALKTKSLGKLVPADPSDPNSSVVRIEGLFEYVDQEGELQRIFFNPGARYTLALKAGDAIKLEGKPQVAKESCEIEILVPVENSPADNVPKARVKYKLLTGKLAPVPSGKDDKRAEQPGKK